MPVKKIQLGQIWKSTASGDTFLVTKIYSEGLSTIAVLRKTGAETEAMTRVKVERTATTQSLPGYVYAQESEEF